MNTQENNKLIAEFMQEGSEGFNLYDYNGCHYKVGELMFHTSWDWLMPVLERIEQVHEGVPQELINLSLFSTIDEVYKTVVEFINQYNK